MEFRTRICPWWISPLQSASHPSLQSATSNAGTSLTVSCVFLMRRLPADRRLKSPMPLPEQVPMQDLPSDVTQDIPLVQGHKFVKFNDRILIVNASSRSVVAMIPRYKLLP